MRKWLLRLATGQGIGQPHCLPIVFLAALINAALPCAAYAQSCATPGRDGDAAASGIVNTYWPGTNNPAAGATSVSLGAATGASTPIAAGDLLLVFQTQDASIDSSNSSAYGDGSAGDPASGSTALRRSGRYEFAVAANAVGLGGGTLSLIDPLVNDYSTQPETVASGQQRFQVIRVPQFANLTLAGSLRAAAWDGMRGGILVLDVQNTLRLNGFSLDASATGFRGGGGRASTSGSGVSTDVRTPFGNGANGSKGEGIAGTPRLVIAGLAVQNNGSEGYPNGSFARGAPGNAGGGGTDGRPSANDQNTGGGGGAGFGSGGVGGYAWCPGGPAVCAQTGGFGGAGVVQQSADRLSLGGGGGAGTTNNATGSPGGGVASSGATGGGLVLVRTGTLTGSGSALANGASANQTVGNDGSGGGGGGGAILFVAQNAGGATLSASAFGGDGGTNGNSTPHGPGGGGGGGFVALTTTLGGTAAQVAGGAPGTTDGNPAPFNSNYGATFGTGGTRVTIAPRDVPGTFAGFECRTVITVTKRSQVVSDPVVGTTLPHALPAAVVEYTIDLTNTGLIPVDSGSLVVTDPIPAQTIFLNTPLAAGLPVAVTGLTLSAAGLAFSDDDATSFAYTPSPGADPAVTTLRVTPGGTLAPGATASVRFRVEIR